VCPLEFYKLTKQVYYKIIALLVEAVNISETSLNFYDTARGNIQEGCHLHIRRRENLKCHRFISISYSWKKLIRQAEVSSCTCRILTDIPSFLGTLAETVTGEGAVYT
jgi:hypothetical protein